MGIRGLTTFMRDNYEWLCVPIGSIKRLVIDGSNLCYKLYEENDHEWVMGGDYPGFHRTVTAFLGKLQTLGISLDIILDGIDYEEEKTATVQKRREESFEQIRRHQSGESAASVLPLLARWVFVDALRGGDLPFYIADGEADAEIVALANFYGCPVLADDSDFYIFNIKGGYIPLQQFFETFEGKTEVRVYNTIRMAQQFNLQDHDLRLLIPAILGNDFMKQVPYPHLQNPKAIIQTISQFPSVREFLHHVPDRVDKASLRKNYSKAAVLYNDVKQIQNPAELSEVTNLNIPKWMLERYRKGRLAPQMVKALMTHKSILPVVVDDIKSKCAHYVGLRIRQYIYGILNCQQPVQETARDNGTTHLTDIEGQCLQFDPPLSLDMICGLDITERSQILCSVLRCHKLVDCIVPEWKLVMASCIYWYKKANPSQDLLKALVKCFVTCRDFHITASQRSYRICLKTLHAYAQWQCIYFYTVALNQLLMEPFEYTNPAYLYSGEVAMHYAAIRSQPEAFETCELTEVQSTLYYHLMEPFNAMKKHGNSAGAHAQNKPKVIKQVVQPETFCHPNRFAILQEEPRSLEKKVRE